MNKILLAVCLFGLTSCAGMGRGPIRIAAIGGVTSISGDDWTPSGTLPAIGLETDVMLTSEWGVEASYLYTNASDAVGAIDFDTTVSSLTLGVRREFDLPGPFMPYLSLGGLYGEAELNPGVGPTSDDSTFGGYAGGGVDFHLPLGFFIGLGVRYVFLTELELNGVSGDMDGFGLLGRIGWGF